MMIFIFLCFVGLFVMFFFIMRGMEQTRGILQEENAQLRAQLRALETRLLGPQETPEPHSLAHDPLDSLSMGDDTAEHPADNALELRFDPQDTRRR